MRSDRDRRSWWPASGLLTLLLLWGCGSGTTPPPEPSPLPRAEIVVDFTAVKEGSVPVSMLVEGMSGENQKFRYRGPRGEYDLHDVRFEDGQGRPISHARKNDLFELQPFEGEVVTAYWVMQPGGTGRHGHQGMIAEDWASFDGRLYLIPRNVGALREVRIRFETPRGWSAATPFREQGDWYYLDTLGPELISIQLESACVGVGRFETRSRMMGQMEIRVSAYSGWADELRERLFDSTFGLMQHFHDELGFDLEAPYSVVWTPGWEGRRVHGGSNVSGTCLQNPDHRLRSFQLLAHRAAHSMNKYRPTGMKMLGAESSWFKEGWPSYMEVVATESVGIAEPPSYLGSLYSTYLRAAKNPSRDIALIDEPTARDQTTEYLHYAKGPLVTQMLDELIRRRTGNTLQHYMRQIWAEHSGFRSPFEIKETLERMTGESLDAFWQGAVHERAMIVPCWKDFVTESMLARRRDTPAGRVGDSAISFDYLRYLAASGEFDSLAEIGRFLVDEEARRRQLASSDRQMCPDNLLPHLAVIPAEARHAVVRMESAQLPLPEKEAGLTFKLSAEPAANDVRRLFEADKRYLAQVSSGAIRALELTTREASDRPQLALPSDGTVSLRIDWRGEARPLTLTLHADGVERDRRKLSADRASRPILVTPVQRPLEEGLLEVAIDVEGQAPLKRIFWQRDPPRSSPSQMSAEDRKDPDRWHSRALILINGKNYSEALQALEQALALAPDNVRYHLTLARLYVSMSRFPEAVSSFEALLKINPDYLVAVGGRAVALAANGDSAAALEAIDGLMRNHEDFAGRFLWQGRVFQRLERTEEAAEAFGRYTEVMPRRIEGWKALGRVLMLLGRSEQALEAIDRGLALNPKDEEAKRLRIAAANAVRGSGGRP